MTSTPLTNPLMTLPVMVASTRSPSLTPYCAPLSFFSDVQSRTFPFHLTISTYALGVFRHRQKTSYPVQRCADSVLRRRISTSCQYFSVWFLLKTLALTFWFLPHVPDSRAVGSVYSPWVTAPYATPFLVMTLNQSIPSFPPLIHFPPSEIGSSSSWKRVPYDLVSGGTENGLTARQPRTNANNAFDGSSSGLLRSALIVPW